MLNGRADGRQRYPATVGRFVVAACACATVLAACSTGAFACTDDSECEPGIGGRCEPSGFCSFPDPECDSGYRYGDHAANGLAQQCVDPVPMATTTASGASTGSEGDGGSTTAEPTTTIPIDDGSTGPTCPDWWDCSWPYRRAVTIAPGTIAEALDGFVVPIELPDISDPARFGPTGYDVRVVATDGTMLPFDVDAWDPSGPAVLWTRLPSVDAASATVAHVYYGQPDAVGEGDPAQTWSDYAAVWHLTDLTDATGHATDAADEGSTVSAGRFGSGRLFDTAGQRLRIAPTRALTDLPVDGMTLVAIVLPNSVGVDLGGRIFDNADGTGATQGITVMPSQQTTSLEVNRGADVSEAAWHGTEPLTYGRYNHIVLTLDDADGASAWVNGVPLTWSIETAPVGVPLSDAMADIGIGGAPYDDTHTFDGIIDEVRLVRGLRSEAWATAQYAVSLGEAVSLGDEETAPQ